MSRKTLVESCKHHSLVLTVLHYRPVLKILSCNAELHTFSWHCIYPLPATTQHAVRRMHKHRTSRTTDFAVIVADTRCLLQVEVAVCPTSTFVQFV